MCIKSSSCMMEEEWWIEIILLVSLEAAVYHAVEPFYIILKSVSIILSILFISPRVGKIKQCTSLYSNRHKLKARN